MKFLPVLMIAGLLSACATRHAVLVTTGTVLGVEVAQNPTSQAYQARFGYARTEFAYVPSNRAADETESTSGGGAKDTTDVIMEIRMHNLFKGGGVYQRLAIGPGAVSQPGAAFMFAKDDTGNLSSGNADAVARAVVAIPEVDFDFQKELLPLTTAYKGAPDKTAFDRAAKEAGFKSFADFGSTTRSAAEIAALKAALEKEGVKP